MSWTFELPIAMPSGNQTLRQHWSFRSEFKQRLAWLLVSALNGQPKIPSATGKRRLTIVRHGKGRLDQDNLAAGCKALIDVIKERKLILDDNPDDCQLEFRQIVIRGVPPKTVVYLEDLV